MGKINIIIRREFNQRVRKKSFIITTLLMPLLMVGLMVVPALLSNIKSDKKKEILTVDHSGIVTPGLKNEGQLVFIPETKSYEELKSENREGIYGILVIGEDVMTNSKNVQLYSYETATMDIESDISTQIEKIIENKKLLSYNIENLPEIMEEVKTKVSMQTIQIEQGSSEEKESSSIIALGSAYIFGFMIYMFIFIYGAMVMQGVIEEKSSKVLEIMVSSVRPFELMMGKIIGIASVALTQVAIWAVFIVILGIAATNIFGIDAMSANTQAMGGGAMIQGMPPMDAESMSMVRQLLDPGFIATLFGAFIVFFIGGYLLYAAMFAAIGSSVESAEDAQQLQLPVTIPLVLAIIILMNVMRNPDGQLAFWFSLVPFTSPIIMMARIPYGVPLWQLALSVVLLYASFMGMVWMAGKVYRVGIFMYGKKPTWKELAKWMKYKY